MVRAMPRPTLEHIVWAKSVPDRHRFSLAESAVDPPDLERLGLPHAAALPRHGGDVVRELEAALAARLHAPGGRVQVTAGGSEANAAAFLALFEPGDEVLVESPGYEPHRGVPAWFGARVRALPRGRDLAADVAAAIGPATRAVVFTDAHNPTGARLTAEQAARLTALALERGLALVCDETFRELDAGPPGTWSALGEPWVCTSTLTKSFGLGGLRIGWVMASPAVLERVARAHDGLSANVSEVSAALALALMPHLDTLRARAHGILARHHARWQAFTARDPRFATPTRPLVTAFPVFDAPGAGDAFAAFAARAFDLALVPGRMFGEPRGVRIGLGAEAARFDPAFAQLERAAAAFDPARAHAPVAVPREHA